MWLVNLTPIGSTIGEIDWTAIYYCLVDQGFKCTQNLARVYTLHILPKSKVVVYWVRRGCAILKNRNLKALGFQHAPCPLLTHFFLLYKKSDLCHIAFSKATAGFTSRGDLIFLMSHVERDRLLS